MNEEHKCDQIKNLGSVEQIDEVNEYPIYGHALLAIHKTEQGWVGHNYEYGDYINFCPFCGKKL